jgi:hypothetical protein
MVDGEPPVTIASASAIQAALEAGGIRFFGKVGDAPGVHIHQHRDRCSDNDA